jgi:hypothetical protein
MHMTHVRLFLARSRSFFTPSLNSPVFMWASYPPRRYPPSSLPSQTYTIPCLGNHFSISCFLKCSILDVGKLRMSIKASMLCSESKAKNFSIDLLLCPMVHIVVCRVFNATIHPILAFSKFRHVPFHLFHFTCQFSKSRFNAQRVHSNWWQEC